MNIDSQDAEPTDSNTPEGGSAKAGVGHSTPVTETPSSAYRSREQADPRLHACVLLWGPDDTLRDYSPTAASLLGLTDRDRGRPLEQFGSQFWYPLFQQWKQLPLMDQEASISGTHWRLRMLSVRQETRLWICHQQVSDHQQQSYRQWIAGVPCGMVLLQGQRIQIANAAFRKIVLEDPQAEWSHDHDYLAGLTTDARFSDQQVLEWDLRTASGNRVPVEATISQVATVLGPKWQVAVCTMKRALSLHELLDQQRRQLGAVADGIPNLISYVDTHLRYQFVNRRYCELWNRSREEIVGRHVEELLGSDAYQVAGPLLQRALQGQTVTDEILIEGSVKPFWVSVVYTPHIVDNQVVGVFTSKSDITRLKLAEDRWNRALTGAGVGIFDWTWERDELLGSSLFWELLGHSVIEGVGNRQAFFGAIVEEDRGRVADELEQYFQRGHGSFETQFRVASGQGTTLWVWLRATVQPETMRRGRNLSGSISSINELKEYELALEEQIRTRDRFMAVLSHELRNPLGTVVSAQTALEGCESETETQEIRNVVRHQLKHMQRLLDDLLEVSRYSFDKVDLATDCVVLNDLARNAMDAVRYDAEQQGLCLVADIPDQPIHLQADYDRLLQCFSNILINAIRHTDRDGTIRLSVRPDDETVTIAFQDTGIGMSEEIRERIFELYFQSGDSIFRSQRGLGIGLSLARRIVELHGGTISVASDGPGKGSCFTIQLPMGQDGRPSVRMADKPAVKSVQGAGILVLVDDLISGRQMLAKILRRRGYVVEEADNGTAAVELVRQYQPFAVLIDIGLPDMTGYELVHKLKSLPEASGACLLALTGFGTSDDVRRSLQAGFDEHFVKPVNLSKLTESLERWRVKGDWPGDDV